MKVLIAEDTEDSRVMLERVLASGGYEVSSAVNGLEALLLAKKDPPDIIVSDIMMPEMDGFELCRKIKADPALRDIPFVFYTATYTERKDKELAMALGASRFILKPAIPQDILRAIGEVLAEPVTVTSQISPKLPINNHVLNSMYRRSVGRKLDKKIVELEKEREALKKSEEKFRTIVEAMTDGVSIIDENYNMKYANSVLIEEFGTFEGRKCYEYFNGLDESCSFCGKKNSYTGKKVHWEWICAKKNKIYDVISVPLRSSTEIVAVLEIRRDITDRKQSEAKLAEQMMHREMLLDSLPHPAMLIGKDRVIISSNRTAMEYGAFPGEICWETFAGCEFVSEEEKQHYRESGSPLPGTCCFFCQADKCLADTGSASNPGIEFGGKIWNMHWVALDEETYLHYAIDVTDERKQQAEHERLISAMEQAAEVVIITDVDGTIQYVNPVFLQATGYTCEEAIGRNPSFLSSGKQSDAFYREMWETLKSGKTWTGRLVNKKKDGMLYTEEASISPVLDTSGDIINFVAVKRDITIEISLQEQSRQMQKMESIGRLAGGVAHDYNNMLGVILGYLEISMEDMDPSLPLYANLMEIRKAAERSVGVTRQLLAFARKQPFSTEILDLNATLAGMLNMLHRLIGENIEILWKPGDSLWSVKVDPSQTDQIIANLCINARDSISGSGKIVIETRNVTISKTYCSENTWFIPGEFVLLTVSDDGCGISKEIMENIFEPFFTTKEIGNGTGMGLATVYGIIKQNNGFINVYSEPGQGTSFKIYLPRYTGADEEHGKNADSAEAARRGDETILVVEDELALLKIIRMMLEGMGYTVLTASTPDEALHIVKDFSSRIDLLITDVVLPEMDGKALTDKLLVTSPGLKCLFMSGYTSGVIAHRGLLDEGVHFIQKPFALADLTAMVRKVLDSE
ncbi:MAG: response regulator [Candidatus Sabulitectum sp.]|nr:response regulator [Candidatus Sabulitectum sp.]